MIIIALVSVDEVAHPRDVFTHRKARNTSTSLLLTLECSPEMKASDVVQHKEQESVVGRKKKKKKTNSSFISGEVAEFALEILMVRNYAQHA